jgi:hypothetical protein
LLSLLCGVFAITVGAMFLLQFMVHVMLFPTLQVM